MDEIIYFDGCSSRRWPVSLELQDQTLKINHAEWQRREALAEIRLERVPGDVSLILHFAHGGHCEMPPSAVPPGLLERIPHHLSIFDRLHGHWAAVAGALLCCLALIYAAYCWGVPWLSRLSAPLMPDAVIEQVSQNTFELLDRQFLQASKLPVARQQAISSSLNRLTAIRSDGIKPRLHFRRSAQLGANAFALPDGQLIVLDALVTQINDREILAVLAHELAHVHYRHGVQQLVQSSILAAASASLFGDVSSLAAGLSTLVLSANYSRQMELEADDYSVGQLRQLGLPPAVLASALHKLERLQAPADKENNDLLSTHPDTALRIRRLATATL